MEFPIEEQEIIEGFHAALHLPPTLAHEFAVHGGCNYLILLEQAIDFVQIHNFQRALCIVKELLEVSWETLHHGHWKEVPLIWRELYSYAAIIKGKCELMNKMPSDALNTLDLALLMGSPTKIDVLNRLITQIAKLNSVTKIREHKKPKSFHPIIKENIERPLIKHGIPRLEAPSLEIFYNNYMKTQTPVIITGSMHNWPALSEEHNWNNLEYFKNLCGFRTVPVEVGKSYVDKDWTQTLMTLAHFIDHYITEDNPTNKGYLAQTQLFDQIPELRKDIIIPDYCALSELNDDEEFLIVNAWFGPKSTVSPAHYDPYHNLLAQVVGEKYVKLFNPQFTSHLYPHQDKLLHNTSQVDVEKPDLEKFPLFSDAKYMECILTPGEMLYIPPKWWHHVRSLSISFSVSFWWS